jgi:glycosyltransferase involved in cell wall biosynthesis
MNQNKSLISVVTVVYNGEALIENTLQSVIAQRNCDYEYIIIDGSSSDNTLSILQKYKDKIDTIVSEPDSGIYNAMNKGARIAKGSYTIFLNCGDNFANEFILQKIQNSFTSIEYDVIYGNILKYLGNELIEKKAEKPGNKHRMYFCHQSCAIRTSILQTNPFDEKYKMSSDFKLFKMLFKNKASFCKVDFPIAIFDTSGVSNTNRSEGLLENIKIINECDKGLERLRLLARIFPSYVAAKIKDLSK